MLSKEVKTELFKMLIGITILTVVMILVFAVCGYFSLPVIFGGLFGAFVAFLNFSLLAVTVEKSIKKSANGAKVAMSTSYLGRLLMIGVAVVISIKSQYLNYLATIIPLIFPRIVIMCADLLKNVRKK